MQIVISRNIALWIVGTLLYAIAFQANSQYEDNPVSRALDLTQYEGNADVYRIRTDDFTSGGSSLQVLPPLNRNNAVYGGFFLPDNVTVTFDYKYIRSETPFHEDLYLTWQSPQGSPMITIPGTGDRWCTRSFYLDQQVVAFQWFILFDSDATPLVLLDNFRVEPGNNVQPTRCGPFRSQPTPPSSQQDAAKFVSPIVSYLLDDDSGLKESHRFMAPWVCLQELQLPREASRFSCLLFRSTLFLMDLVSI